MKQDELSRDRDSRSLKPPPVICWPGAAAWLLLAMGGCDSATNTQQAGESTGAGAAPTSAKMDQAACPSPVPAPHLMATVQSGPPPAPARRAAAATGAAATPAPISDTSAGEDPAQGLRLLGATIPPGTSRRLTWSSGQIFEGISAEAPVLVINGRQTGPTLCLTAAIHGDELNGIEMVRRVLHDLKPEKLHGAVIGIPIVNLQGFRRGSRYLPDRRDLNRYFPGNPEGSSAARIAYSLFNSIIRHCDALVDLHTGSFHRTNLPQLRADLRYPAVRDLIKGFGGMVVLHSEAAGGTLRRAATESDIPAVTIEAGEPQRLQSGKVKQGVEGIFKLLDNLGMVQRVEFLKAPEPVFYESAWIRADSGGILFSVVRLGQVVQAGDVLGTVTDPISNAQDLIYSPARGRVLGMAVNQVVMPGFATFRIGIETDGPASNSRLEVLDELAYATRKSATRESASTRRSDGGRGDSAE